MWIRISFPFAALWPFLMAWPLSKQLSLSNIIPKVYKCCLAHDARKQGALRTCRCSPFMCVVALCQLYIIVQVNNGRVLVCSQDFNRFYFKLKRLKMCDIFFEWTNEFQFYKILQFYTQYLRDTHASRRLFNRQTNHYIRITRSLIID